MTTPLSSITPAGSGSLRNAAIAEIRRRIISGELPAGVTFSEGALGDELGFSRAPTREALIVLNQLGWVSAQPRSGYLVAPMTLNDLRDLFAVRALLEPRAAELAARHIERRHESGDAIAEFAEHEDNPRSDGWIDAHYRFHRRIVIAAQNREIDRVLTEVLLKLERYLALPAVMRALVDEHVPHTDLADAVTGGRPREALDAAALHVSRCQLTVTEAILSSEAIRSMTLGTDIGRPAGTK